MPSADRFELKEFKQWKKKIESLGADVLPRVIAETINVVAGFAHVDSVRNVRRRFVNRNKYTENSVRFYKANPKKDWKKINAVTGSISDYMDEQDSGGYRFPKKGRVAAVTTLYARGNKSTQRKRNKFKLGQAENGDFKKHFFVGMPRGTGKNLGKKFGIYERTNGNKKIRMTHNLESEKVEIKETKWHRDGVDQRVKNLIPEFIRQAKMELEKLTRK